MSIDRILSWFPGAWRARYEAEIRDLLESGPFGWRERRDLLRCCVDAWMREGSGWSLRLTRIWLSLVPRIGVVLVVGWLCAKGVTWVEPYIGVSAWKAGWSGTATTIAGFVTWFKIAAFIALARYAISPYARSGREVDRPGWWQAVGGVLFLSLLQLLDPRPPHLGDVMFFGFVATMRFGHWLQFFGTPTRREGMSILGLR